MSFYDNAIDYVEKYGFSVIPVGRNKRPLVKWEIYMSRKPREDELRQWDKDFPEANVGIVTGAVSGIVVADADSTEAANRLKEIFPITSVYVNTAKGKHAYFKHPGGRVQNGVRVLDCIDIRGDGGYVVAPPSVHESGVVYTLEFTTGLNGFDDLAEFKMPGGDNPMDFNDVEIQKQPIEYTKVKQGSRNAELARIAGEKIGRGESLKDTIIFLLGCNQTFDPPLSNREVETIANSIYKTHLRNNPSEASIRQANVQPITISKPVIKGYSKKALNPGGLMQETMDYIKRTAPVYNPIYALGATIAMWGAVIGLRYCTETGLYTNFYCINVGVSGSGKDAPQKAISKLLRRTTAYNILGSNELASSAAILKELELADDHTLLDIYDEIGLLLSSFKDKAGFRKDIPSLMMRLFTQTGESFTKSYAEQDKHINIPYEHFSFLGSSTPIRFWESMTSSEAADGFISRMLLFNSEVEPEMPDYDLDFSVPQGLADAISNIYNVPVKKDYYMINGKKDPEDKSTEFIIPTVVKKTEKAKAYFRQWEKGYFELKKKYDRISETFSSIYSRAAALSHKLALLHALTASPDIPFDDHEVGLDDVIWACETVDCCINNLVDGIQYNIADNDFERWNLKVKMLIKKYVQKWGDGRPGAPLSYLNNNLKSLTVKDLESVLKKLDANGEVKKKEWHNPKTGKDGEYFVLTSIIPE